MGGKYYKDFEDWLTGKGGKSGAQRDAEREARKAERQRERDAANERRRLEAETRKAERERKQKEWEIRQAERERKKREWEAKQSENERRKLEREAERDRRRLGGKPLFSDAGLRIGSHPKHAEKRSMARALKLTLGDTGRDKKAHGHHSHPVHLGGDKKQPLTILGSKKHSRLHDDMHQFFRQRGVETAGKRGKDIEDAHGHEKLRQMTGDFYSWRGSNGGAKYMNAATAFFSGNPDLKNNSAERVNELKTELSKHKPQEEREVVRKYYEEKFKKPTLNEK